jgi:hypothetical protein
MSHAVACARPTLFRALAVYAGTGRNATHAPSTTQVTARNATNNAVLGPNASVSVGFQASHTGHSAAATAGTLDGAACTVA